MPSGLEPLLALVRDRASNFLTNTRTGLGFCLVCRSPVEPRYSHCPQCRGHAMTGNPLADLVVPLAYAGHTEQSGHLLHHYKSAALIADGRASDLQATVLVVLFLALRIHGSCLNGSLGPWTSLTCVPSTRLRESPSPLRELTRLLGVALDLPVIDVEFQDPQERGVREYVPDRYLVADRDGVASGHVLIVDDTWTSGHHAQSVATSLKRRGAQAVTVITLGRWLDAGWSPSLPYFDRATVQPPYDPLICPGGVCS